mmetsp:Transcript_24197/g.57022  ORF Transcript_24197/g.57022 Transcript_24197/m.57022 type:complete len:224 (-) Transcript_24197:409-1080(-)|eukprot:CAMPEP_0197181230 /NCGR_PEP_ID=MMETSP1423-20130617/5579_1 /TAXON_ID=476441 /ORGANISM="Pseudo-nitzschia heimii, Strain UNC1101" /LENGTH=223 /DNA_ID=CAMNT_0042631445 /DNA_START=101 /DNA_END=772 /DNA_ORIENTATION=-
MGRADYRGTSVVRAKRSQPTKVTPKKVTPKEKKGGPKKAAPKKKAASKEDTVKTILEKMASMDEIGMTEVNEQILLTATGYARSDSKGFRNAIKNLAKELGYIERKAKIYTLTDKGRNHLLEIGLITIQEEPKSNEQLHHQLKETLEKHAGAPKQKIEDIFKALEDGNWHTTQNLLAASGYKRPDSSGYRKIMSGMKRLDMLEKSGKQIRFNDNVFKFGRPNE